MLRLSMLNTLPLTLIGYGLKFCLGIAMTPFLYMMKVSKPDMHTTVLLHSATSMFILVSAEHEARIEGYPSIH